jgi:hypothetical protein
MAEFFDIFTKLQPSVEALARHTSAMNADVGQQPRRERVHQGGRKPLGNYPRSERRPARIKWCTVHGSGGHHTVDCRQAPAAQAQANVAETYVEAVHPAVNELPLYTISPVVLNSGATPSFLRNRTSFVKALRPSPVLRFADGATAQTRGQGPAVIRYANGQLQLRNAIHAPEMRNMLSVSDLAENHDVLF